MENELHTEKYATENMGEVIITDMGFATSIQGKYNLMDINMALIQLIDFKKNRNFIMNLVNQYDKIHEITKKAIMDDINCKEEVKDYFTHLFDEKELFELFGIKTFEEFNIDRIIKNIECPRLYFEGGLGDEITDFSVQYWFSGEYSDEIILYIIMDEKLNILNYMIEPDFPRNNLYKRQNHGK